MFFPKRSKIQKSQRGFTLVAVMILSGLASILVLSSIKDNVNQERLSGNFQKKLNARLMSERGIFDAISEAETYLNNNSSASVNDLALNINDLSKLDNTGLIYGGMKYKVQFDADGDELVLSSTGNRFEGESSLKVRLKITPGGSGSAFADAIVGCDAVNLTGSGQIDSYNSAEAPYDVSSPGIEGDVTTINKDGADVKLGGYSPIYGDISATGNVNFNTSSIVGNVHANGNVIIPDAGDVERVSGYVITRSNFEFTGGSIGGYVRAQKTNGSGGNISLTRAEILNKNNVNLDIMYGGTYTPLEIDLDYTGAEFSTNPLVVKVKDSDETALNYDPTDPATNCDHLDIENVIEVISLDAQPSFDFISRGWGDIYRFDSIGLIGPNNDISPTNAQVLGEPASVTSLNSFHLKGSDSVDVSGGDMTLFIDGDFTMDGATQMTIDADSSLTLVITGTVNMLAGAKIIAQQQGLTTSGLPAMSIYSSYDSTIKGGPGINIEGDFETYAQIYAPLSDVIINGSGTLYGAVRGKTISVTGGAAIHYDAALGENNRGGSFSSQSSLKFVGFEY
jgi:cytoskeletal protein CcmA (bactofilin family)